MHSRVLLTILMFQCFFVFNYSALANEERVKLILFLDKSTSMGDELTVIADLADQITNRLDSRCSSYSIAVSELRYGDIASDPVGIIGYPAFITEEHPHPAQELRDRILAYSPTESCVVPGDCTIEPANHVGTLEYTYSSIVTTFQKNKNQIFDEQPIRHLSTLIVTDAAPLSEPYSIESALKHIESFIPLSRFSTTSLSHENWHDITNSSCVMDLPSKMDHYSIDNLKGLHNFAQSTYGSSFNICDSRSKNLRKRLELQIKDFIDEVILKGCLLTS